MTEFHDTIQKVFTSWGETSGSDPQVIAHAFWEAVTDGTDKFRYRAGDDAVALLDQRKAVDDATFFAAIRSQFGL